MTRPALFKKPSLWLSLAQAPLWLLVASMLLPFYSMANGAIKTVDELVRQPPTFWVDQPILQNFYDPGFVGHVQDPDHGASIFQRASEGFGFGSYYFNSLAVMLFISVDSNLAASLVAFGLTKKPFPGSRWLFNLMLASKIVPWEVTIIPNFLGVAQLGWINRYSALLVPGLTKAFAVFYFRQIILSVLSERVDAAMTDGAGTVRIGWSVVLPLLRPALSAIAIPGGIAEWNNFLWPLLVINDGKHTTLPLALGSTVLMAGSLIASLPAIAAFLFFQRQFANGLAAVATKG